MRLFRATVVFFALLAVPGASRAEERTRAQFFDSVDGSSLVAGRLAGPSAPATLSIGQSAFLKKISATGEEIWSLEGTPGFGTSCAPGGCGLLASLPGLHPDHIQASSLEAVTVDPVSGEIFAAGEILLAWQEGNCPIGTTFASAAVALHLSSAGDVLDSAYFGPSRLEHPPLPGQSPCPAACEFQVFSSLTGKSFEIDKRGKLTLQGWLGFDPDLEAAAWSPTHFSISNGWSSAELPVPAYLELLYAGPLDEDPSPDELQHALNSLNAADGEALSLPLDEQAILLVFDASTLAAQAGSEHLTISFGLSLPPGARATLLIKRPKSFQAVTTVLSGDSYHVQKTLPLAGWQDLILNTPEWGEVIIMKLVYSVPSNPECLEGCLKCAQSGIGMDSIKIQKPPPG